MATGTASGGYNGYGGGLGPAASPTHSVYGAMDGGGSPRAVERMDARRLIFCIKSLVPEYSSGALLGRGGSTMKELTHRSGATIKLSPPNQDPATTGERIVSVMGPKDCVLPACMQVYEILAAEPRK